MPNSKVFNPHMLTGKTVLITGGGTGLGFAAASELQACRARIAIVGRRAEVLEKAAERLGDCEWLSADIREDDEPERIINWALERFGRLDAVVNNAGGQFFAPAESIAYKGFKAVTALNFSATVKMCRAAVELAFKRSGGGALVNVTLSPHHGLPGMVHSSAARAAVEAATAELAAEWSSLGVSVVALAAGHFDTEVLAKYPASVRQGLERIVPLQRLGRPEELAWLVALAISPLGRSLSGSVVTIDGARDNWFGSYPPITVLDESGRVPAEQRRRA